MQGNKKLNPLYKIAKSIDKKSGSSPSPTPTPTPATGVNVYFWEEAARAPQAIPKCNLTAQELLDTIADCLINNVNCSIYSLITSGNINVTLLNSVTKLDGTAEQINIADDTAKLTMYINIPATRASGPNFEVAFNSNTVYSETDLDFTKINAFASSIRENLHIS